MAEKQDNTPNFKRCSKCAEVKPGTDFYKCQSKKDGLQHRCKDCLTAFNNDRKAAVKIARLAGVRRVTPETPPLIQCNKCKAVKTPADFHKNRSNRYGLSYKCKQCVRAAEAARPPRAPRHRPYPPRRFALPLPPEKRCSKCREIKDIGAFQRRTGKNRRDGLHSWCRMCTAARRRAKYFANPEASRARSRAYAIAHPRKAREYRQRAKTKESYRDRRYLREYGITWAQKNAMRVAQNNACAICTKEFKNVQDCHVDHDHNTAAVRALLCNRCNVGVGMFLDDPSIMAAAIEYVRLHARKARLA